MAPPENSPSVSKPSFVIRISFNSYSSRSSTNPNYQDSPSYHSPLLSESAPDSPGGRIFTPSIVSSPLLQSIAQTPPIDGDNVRVRHRGVHGQPRPRLHRVTGDLQGLSGNDDRMRRITGPTRLRQSLRDNDLRQQPQQDQAYGPRVPFWRPGQRQSLYGWAPTTPPGEEFESRSLPPLVDGGELNDGTLRDAPFPQRADSPLPLASGSQSQTQVRREPSANTRTYESLFGTSTDPSFAMQPTRQNLRRPIRSRSQWHGWSWEREHEREGRDDTFRSRLEWRDTEVMLRSRPFRIRSENYRDLSSSSSSSYELEEAIKYLAKLRTSSGPEESLRLAVKAGFNRGDDWLKMLDEEFRYDDLLLDTHFLHVAETSWLKVGGVFWGSQTTPPVAPIVLQRTAVSPASSTPSNTTTAAGPHPDDPGRVAGRVLLYYGSNPHHWTVKVVISSIDYSQLRLSKYITSQISRSLSADYGQCLQTGYSWHDGSFHGLSETCL